MRLYICILSLIYVTNVLCRDVLKSTEEYCYSIKPAQFCHDLHAATRCNSLNDCKIIWKKKLNYGKDYASCVTCKTYMNKLREAIHKNITTEILREALINICEESSSSNFCPLQVDKHVEKFKALVDVLRSDLKSATICRLLRFCNHTTIQETSSSPSTRCYKGSTYWCKNIKTAKECGAINFCDNFDWKFSRFEEDDGSVCDLCRNLVHKSRQLVQNNVTNDELRKEFHRFCRLMPLKPLVTECAYLTDHLIADIRKIVASDLNSTGVCSVIGFCNNANIDKLLQQYPITTADVVLDACTNCSVAWTRVEDYVLSSSKGDVYRKLLSVCGVFGKFASLCVRTVTFNFEDTYSLLLNIQPWSVCHVSGMCPNTSRPSFKDLLKEKRAEIKLMQSESTNQSCDLCEQFLDHLKKFTTEDSLLGSLQMACNMIQVAKNECLEEVEKEYKTIYGFIQNDMNSFTTCTDIGFCTQNITPTPSTVQSHQLCSICKGLVSSMQDMMNQSNVEGKLKLKLEEICSLAASQYSVYCKTFVEDHLNLIIDLMRSKVANNYICPALDLCPKSNVTELQAVPVTGVKINSCDLCRSLVQELDNRTFENFTQESLQISFSGYCDGIPDLDMRNGCSIFVADNSQKIFHCMSDNVSMSEVCEVAKICPPVVQYGNESTRSKCLSCQLIVGALKNYIEDPYNYNKIFSQINEDIIAFICSLMGEKQTMCNEILHQLVPQIEAIPLEIPNWFICSKLSYCPYLMPENSRLISHVRQLPNLGVEGA